jgi:tetratricopeptide (TPR) repeat protein
MSRFAVACAVVALAVWLGATDPTRAMMPNADGADGSEAGALMKKATMQVDMKQYRDAVATLQMILKNDPKSADALNLLGYSQRRLGDPTLAVETYNKALALDPDHKGANEYLGEAYLELNKLPLAEARLEHLNSLCGTGCKEYKALAQAIATYKAGRHPPPSSSRAW